MKRERGEGRGKKTGRRGIKAKGEERKDGEGGKGRERRIREASERGVDRASAKSSLKEHSRC